MSDDVDLNTDEQPLSNGSVGDNIETETNTTVVNEQSEEVQKVEDEIRVFFQSVGVTDLVTALESRSKLLGTEEFQSRVEIVGSYENLLSQAINEYSGEAQRVLSAINAIEDKTEFDNKLIRDGKTILTSVLTPRRPSGNGKMLTGRQARIEFAIKSGQVKRIPLYNSGFTVDIEAAQLSDLNNFFNRAFDETNTYGRELGAAFFYYNDLLIKEAVVDLIIPQIIGSSLKGWNKENVLLTNIKLSSLKVILNGLAALMFPEGFEYTHVCPNPSGECTHVEKTLIDITKLFRHNFMKLPEENIDMIRNQVDITHEKLTEYHNSLNFKKSVRYGNIEFILRDPSLYDYLSYGKKFNTELLKGNLTDNVKSINPEEALMFSYYKIFVPYIKSVALYDSDNKIDIITDDEETITHQLSILQKNDKDRTFIADIEKYINDCEITQICYPAMPCPKCNYMPQTGGGYYTVDPINTFFTQSLKKLTLG